MGKTLRGSTMLRRYMQLGNAPFLHGSPYPQLCSTTADAPRQKTSWSTYCIRIVAIRIYLLRPTMGKRAFKETTCYRVLIQSRLKHFIWIAWLVYMSNKGVEYAKPKPGVSFPTTCELVHQSRAKHTDHYCFNLCAIFAPLR